MHPPGTEIFSRLSPSPQIPQHEPFIKQNIGLAHAPTHAPRAYSLRRFAFMMVARTEANTREKAYLDRAGGCSSYKHAFYFHPAAIGRQESAFRAFAHERSRGSAGHQQSAHRAGGQPRQALRRGAEQ